MTPDKMMSTPCHISSTLLDDTSSRHVEGGGGLQHTSLRTHPYLIVTWYRTVHSSGMSPLVCISMFVVIVTNLVVMATIFSCHAKMYVVIGE